MIKWYVLLFLNSILSAIAQTFLKKSANMTHASLVRQYLNVFVVIGYLIFFIVLFVNIYIMRFINLNIVSTVSVTIPFLMSIVLGKLVFGEIISERKLIGMSIIFVGTVVLTI